jgi:SAM-dependent methyltransferase
MTQHAGPEPRVAALRRIDRAIFGTLDTEVIQVITREVVGSCATLLDVGCGSDSIARYLPKDQVHSVGVDISPSAIEASGQAHIHSEYRVLDVTRLAEHFEDGSFDCVMALDVIEHLEKRDGLDLLRAMERLARRKVIILTPNGFVPQEAHDGNPFQRHLSGWSPEEMERHGYRIVGMSGWRPLRGELAEPRWQPRMFWHRFSLLTQPLVRSRPKHAFHLLCLKDL